MVIYKCGSGIILNACVERLDFIRQLGGICKHCFFPLHTPSEEVT